MASELQRTVQQPAVGSPILGGETFIPSGPCGSWSWKAQTGSLVTTDVAALLKIHSISFVSEGLGISLE